MNLYLVTRLIPHGFDEYEAFVCRATDAEAARHMHPSGKYVWEIRTEWNGKTSDDAASRTDWFSPTNWPAGPYGTWVNPALTTALLLGVSDDPTPGIVLASFNAA